MTIRYNSQFENFEEYEKSISEEMAQQFKSSLLFIARYTTVSWDAMTNYANQYPVEVYQEDREKWLKWYEEHKCNAIQFVENNP